MADDLGPILLTGASGYLGQHILARVKARGLPCVATSRNGRVGEACDLLDAASVGALLDRTAPSVVIHCAASVPKSIAAYGDIAAAEASVAMLKTVANHTTSPIVLASSMTVYGAAPDCPVREESASRPALGYARGKWDAEQLLVDRHQTGDVAVRLPGLFGLPRRSGLVYAAARKFFARDRFEITVPEGPWAAMAVEDAAECMVRVATIRSRYGAQALNAGYEGEFGIVSAVTQVASICGVEWHSSSTTEKPFSMNLERFHSRYGTLAVTFRQRLNEFIDAVRHDDLT